MKTQKMPNKFLTVDEVSKSFCEFLSSIEHAPERDAVIDWLQCTLGGFPPTERRRPKKDGQSKRA